MLSCTVECQPHRMLHALGREHRIAVVIHHPRDTQCPMYTPLSIMCAPCSETLHIEKSRPAITLTAGLFFSRWATWRRSPLTGSPYGIARGRWISTVPFFIL